MVGVAEEGSVVVRMQVLEEMVLGGISQGGLPARLGILESAMGM